MGEPIAATGFDTYPDDRGTLLRVYHVEAGRRGDAVAAISLSDDARDALLGELALAMGALDCDESTPEGLAALTDAVARVTAARDAIRRVESELSMRMVRAHHGARIFERGTSRYVCTLVKGHQGRCRNTATGIEA
jgi:hypothetical protein